jgi:hypothetical protein
LSGISVLVPLAKLARLSAQHMTTLLRSAHFVVQHHLAACYVHVMRTAEPFLRHDVAARALGACEVALKGVDRTTTGILLDYRRAPMSTDPELDKALAVRGDALIIPFARSAILVATHVGVLQADRISRTYSQSGTRTFHDESAALRHVASA